MARNRPMSAAGFFIEFQDGQRTQPNTPVTVFGFLVAVFSLLVALPVIVIAQAFAACGSCDNPAPRGLTIETPAATEQGERTSPLPSNGIA
jgi:hypothetical protein